MQVSNAGGIYLRASASPAIPAQFRAILRNSAQLGAIREPLQLHTVTHISGQFCAIPRYGIPIGNPSALPPMILDSRKPRWLNYLNESPRA